MAPDGPEADMTHDPNWIEVAVKGARPRAIAALLRQFGSVELAEEAFQEACLRALRTWPDRGPPGNATAWLVRVGSNAGIDRMRRARREAELPEGIAAPDMDEDQLADAIDAAACGDDVLRLLFICCHRDLPSTQQMALALRVVCGLPVADIARAFLVSEAAMEQRITRAKRTIGDADIRFETPSPAVRAERLVTVSAMIYLIFTRGHAASAREAPDREPLCDEAIRLGRLLMDLYAEDAEVRGLLALMLLQHSRRAARFDDGGDVILLEAQDRTLWDRAAIMEGTTLIDDAFRMGQPGPYQVQAAIAALHARAKSFEETDWSQIERLYRVLEEMWPTPVVTLNHAVAIWHAHGVEAGLSAIAPLETALSNYLHYHAVKGRLLAAAGRPEEARQAYAASLGLADSAAEAAQIRAYIDQLSGRS